MKIHEYQGKIILEDYQISIPKGIPAFSIEDALKAYDSLDSDFVAIKAQIHAGGRGKGGGVKIAKNRTDAENHISDILGMNLVTHQTGPNGKKVELLTELDFEAAKEFATQHMKFAKELNTLAKSMEGKSKEEQKAFTVMAAKIGKNLQKKMPKGKKPVSENVTSRQILREWLT